MNRTIPNRSKRGPCCHGSAGRRGAVADSVLAQVPARFYWKSLSGGNAVPVIFNSLSGNANPFDPANTVVPGANFDATMALVGYAQSYSLFDRAAMGAILLPMGRVSGDVTVGALTAKQSASGYGDRHWTSRST